MVSDSIPAEKPFYPEVVRAYSDRRRRIAAIAEDNEGGGPRTPPQVALFSLGGFYDYEAASHGTQPKGTTCLLFARSVWHAAGYNMIAATSNPNMCNVPNGLGSLPSEVGYVRSQEFRDDLHPDVGDIFHISGEPFHWKAKDGKVTDGDSSHFGVILDIKKLPGSWVMTTVEGGAPDHVTSQAKTRKLVPASQDLEKKYGKWVFDSDVVTPKRPLQGWLSVATTASQRWMRGA
jgi:hypothetical protein